MFIAALFTIARTWKQPGCPPTDECIKVIHIYYAVILSHKKEHIQMTSNELDEPRASYTVK